MLKRRHREQGSANTITNNERGAIKKTERWRGGGKRGRGERIKGCGAGPPWVHWLFLECVFRIGISTNRTLCSKKWIVKVAVFSTSLLNWAVFQIRCCSTFYVPNLMIKFRFALSKHVFLRIWMSKMKNRSDKNDKNKLNVKQFLKNRLVRNDKNNLNVRRTLEE